MEFNSCLICFKGLSGVRAASRSFYIMRQVALYESGDKSHALQKSITICLSGYEDVMKNYAAVGGFLV